MFDEKKRIKRSEAVKVFGKEAVLEVEGRIKDRHYKDNPRISFWRQGIYCYAKAGHVMESLNLPHVNVWE